MTIVIAHYRTEPKHVARIREVLGRHAAASAAEPGCLRFDVLQNHNDPTRFALYEEYTDDAAFEAHRTTAHFLENIEGIVAPLLAERRFAKYDGPLRAG